MVGDRGRGWRPTPVLKLVVLLPLFLLEVHCAANKNTTENVLLPTGRYKRADSMPGKNDSLEIVKTTARLGRVHTTVLHLQESKSALNLHGDPDNDDDSGVTDNESRSVKEEDAKNLKFDEDPSQRDMQTQANKLALMARFIARLLTARPRPREATAIRPKYNAKLAARVPIRTQIRQPPFQRRPDRSRRRFTNSAAQTLFKPKPFVGSVAANSLHWRYFGSVRRWGRNPWQWRNWGNHNQHQLQNDAAYSKLNTMLRGNGPPEVALRQRVRRPPNANTVLPQTTMLNSYGMQLQRPPTIQAHGYLPPSRVHGKALPHHAQVKVPGFQVKSPLRAPSFKKPNFPQARNLPNPGVKNIANPSPAPQMPDMRAVNLPTKMNSPGMPDAQQTLRMVEELMRDGKIPPINFNCNSRNRILHIVHQLSKRSRRRKRSTNHNWSGSSSSESDDDSVDQSKQSDGGDALVPSLKKVEAKVIHSLNHMRLPSGAPRYIRPIIHHHGPRIILVCISNTYLKTLIHQHRGSSSK